MSRNETRRASPTAAISERGHHVRTFWRIETPSGRVLTCALYRLADEFELRVGEGDDDRWLSQRLTTARAADVFSTTWLGAAEARGFRLLPTLDSANQGRDDAPAIDGRPLCCPSCLAHRGTVRYVTTPPRKPGALLLSVVCAVCGHAWRVLWDAASMRASCASDEPQL